MGRSELKTVTGHFEKGRRKNMHRPPLYPEKNCVTWYFCLCLPSETIRHLLVLGDKYLIQDTWKFTGVFKRLSEMACTGASDLAFVQRVRWCTL